MSDLLTWGISSGTELTDGLAGFSAQSGGVPMAPTGFVRNALLVIVPFIWQSVNGATGYRIYKDNNSTPIYDGSATSFSDIIKFNEVHSYELTAYNGSGESSKTLLIQVSTTEQSLTIEEYVVSSRLFVGS